MTLEAQAAAYIDELNALDAPSFRELGAQAARARYEAAPPSGLLIELARIEDELIVGGSGQAMRVRCYRPSLGADVSAKGALVYFHGGGWAVGSIDTHDRTCRALCEAAGAVVISVDYRLAPEHPFPAAPEDCFAATRWVVEHAADLGVDPTRVAVGGDSAGGNLAAVVALMWRERARGLPPLGMQLLIYPVTDFDRDRPSMRSNAVGFGLTRDDMLCFDDWYCPVARRRDPWAAPLRAETLGGLPCAWILVAGHDPLRDEGVAYAQRLAMASVPTTLVEYPGQVHGFFRKSERLRQALEAQGLAATALRLALHP